MIVKIRDAFSKIKSNLLILCLLTSLSQSAFAIGTFIDAPGRVDMAYDEIRKVLYITSGSSVLRYSVDTNSFLSPYEFSGTLQGIDISQDSNTLAIADNNLFGIHLIDLKTDISRRANYKPGMERGSFSVAFGDNNTLLISSSLVGSGWVPLRKYDLPTNTFTELASVRQDTMLCASADGKVIGFAESNTSGGDFGRYDLEKNKLERKKLLTGGFNFDIAVNRNGSQFVRLTGLGHLIDDNFEELATFSGPLGAAYSPVKDILYLPWTGTSQIYAYDINTLQKIAAYDVESHFSLRTLWPFANSGRTKISRDGKYLFVTVGGGIKFINLSEADSNSKLIQPDSSVRMINQ